ncbi:MAG: hypothetical protein ACI857_002323 [Arenicella sp.]|jgi:hypothetical protein
MRSLVLIFFGFLSQSVAAQLCPGATGQNLFPEGDFGSGAANILQTDPGIAQIGKHQLNSILIKLSGGMAQLESLVILGLEVHITSLK